MPYTQNDDTFKCDRSRMPYTFFKCDRSRMPYTQNYDTFKCDHSRMPYTQNDDTFHEMCAKISISLPT